MPNHTSHGRICGYIVAILWLYCDGLSWVGVELKIDFAKTKVNNTTAVCVDAACSMKGMNSMNGMNGMNGMNDRLKWPKITVKFVFFLELVKDSVSLLSAVCLTLKNKKKLPARDFL